VSGPQRQCLLGLDDRQADQGDKTLTSRSDPGKPV
jgi:hypothetical protein